MKKSYKIAALLMLSSTLLLTGCHKNSSQSKTHSSSAKTSQTSKTHSQKGSSQNQSSQSSDQNQTNGGTTTSSSSTNQGSDNNQASTSSLDITAISNDFSSIAGTWQNTNGETLVFDDNGLVSDTQVISSQGVSGEKALFGIGPKDSEVGSAVLFVIPAGVPTVGGKTYQQDALVVGQSESAESTPYYRVS